MKTILVPLDFSEQSIHALNFAYSLAKESGMRISMVHIIEHPGVDSINASGDVTLHDDMDKVFMLQLLKKVKTDLKELAESPEYSGVTLNYNVLIGHPFKSISREITDSNADLVVMGTHGTETTAEELIGSVAGKVVRFAKSPVITLKEKADASTIKNIVFATNLVGDQRVILDPLKRLVEFLGAHLHILRVNTPYAFLSTHEVQEKMQAFAAEHEISEYTPHTYDDFREEQGIIRFAKDQHMDLIAMGTHSHTGLVHVFTGSIAEDVVNHGSCPVWTISLRREDD